MQKSGFASLMFDQVGWLLLLPLCFFTACDSPHNAQTLPSGSGPILILDIDTLRADHLGCYGYERPTSPHIDALARESFRFEWAFSQAPNTPPSQSSILTGLYPSNHGMIWDHNRLPESVTTLAEVYTEAGYRTAAFVDGGYMRTDFGLDQGFDSYEVFHRVGLEQIAPRAMQWLETHAAENFLLLVHTYDTHTPYDPPGPYKTLFTSGIEPTPGFEPDAKTIRDIRESHWTSQPLSLGPADLAFTKARYDGSIRFVDDWVGRILDKVGELGLDRRLTIVFLSDHGEAFQEHGTLGHNRLYAPVTRIPLLIRPPGGTEEETVISSTVQSIDLMPTLLEWTGLPTPPPVQGRSLLPLMRGERLRERPAFAESSWLGRQRAVVFGDHHLVAALENDEVELFNFRQDPLELQELSEEHPDVVEEHVSLGRRWQASMDRRGRPQAEPRPLDNETIQSLRALGYLD